MKLGERGEQRWRKTGKQRRSLHGCLIKTIEFENNFLFPAPQTHSPFYLVLRIPSLYNPRINVQDGGCQQLHPTLVLFANNDEQAVGLTVLEWWLLFDPPLLAFMTDFQHFSRRWGWYLTGAADADTTRENGRPSCPEWRRLPERNFKFRRFLSHFQNLVVPSFRAVFPLWGSTPENPRE